MTCRVAKLPRELPAEWYDAIIAKADEVGGVGAGRMFRSTNEPCCLYGIACAAGLLRERELYALSDARTLAGLRYVEVDEAVNDIRHVGQHRVPVRDLFTYLGIVRSA